MGYFGEVFGSAWDGFVWYFERSLGGKKVLLICFWGGISGVFWGVCLEDLGELAGACLGHFRRGFDNLLGRLQEGF